ncbi:MAG: site-2 protease family protein [Pyrinomonadaceae bacterium]
MSDLNSATNQLFSRREAMRPTLRTWLKHSLLLLLTVCTATIAGVIEPFGAIRVFPDVNPQSGAEILQLLLSLPFLYLQIIAGIIQTLAAHPAHLIYGLKFSVSLLTILTAHEAGHYVTCRLYGVDATLPYFIPTPPLIGPAGTLGAFIKILSPLPSRRATFDIGVAGPIAGFLMLIPVAVLGFLTMHNIALPAGANLSDGGIYFSDPLLLKLLAPLFGINLSLPVAPNPFYMAAWLGLLITSLNLIPSGQLDGGHAIYAIFGERIHKWTGYAAFAIMGTISVLGWFLYNSPSGLLFTILLAVMMRIKHPEPSDDTPLDYKRLLVAVLVLIIFALCFVPFPIQIT